MDATEVRIFLGHVGMAEAHQATLVPPGERVRAAIELGSEGDGWRQVGTLEFSESGRKLSFALESYLACIVQVARVLRGEAEWIGRETSGPTPTPQELQLARWVSRLADQIRDVRDIDHYAENPVQLPFKSVQVLRVVRL